MKENEIFQKAHYFETFVISVLRQMASKEKRKFYTENELLNNNFMIESDIFLKKIRNQSFHGHLNFDAFAPEGIGEIKGPVIIEIQYNPRSMNYRKIEVNGFEQATTLYIVSSDLKNNPKAKKAKEDRNIIIWDNAIISHWEELYPIDYYSFYSEKLPVDDKFNFINKVESNKEQLKESLSKKKISFSLGAGVSISYKIPSWENLIKNFYDKLQLDGKVSDVDAVKNKIGNTSIINGQFVEENTKDFFKMLHKEFYDSNITPYITDNTTLALLAKIVKKLATARRFNVVTYNYDDILEKLLDELLIQYNVVYSNAQNISDDLTIYHVHGYLPRETNAADREDYKKSIVFSETAYYKVYNDPFNWSHILQQNIYRENTFLFLGCSLSDPYLRRILDTTKSKDRPHFCFMLTDGLNKFDQLIVHRHFARMGVECIWFNNLEEYMNELKVLEGIC